MKSFVKNIGLYIFIILFGAIGVYLVFFHNASNKYDSKTTAYKIDENETYDHDNGTLYYPVYYYRVNGVEYECKSKSGTNYHPNEEKNTVYYNSINPSDCKNEYEKESTSFLGIIILVIDAFAIIFVISSLFNKSKKTDQTSSAMTNSRTVDYSDNIEKIANLVGEARILYQRIIIGIVILVLVILTLLDVVIIRQTMKSMDYEETYASLVETKKDDSNEDFVDNIYVFKDNQGNEHKIVTSGTTEDVPKESIRVRYDESNPEINYWEGKLADKNKMTWFGIKIVAIIVLLLIFFNKKLLSKGEIGIGI